MAKISSFYKKLNEDDRKEIEERSEKESRQLAYQENLAKTTQPENTNWYSGEKPTRREAFGKVYSMSETDKNNARTAYSLLETEQADPTSNYYAPYLKPTNPAFSNLQSMGITVGDDIDQFIKDYNWLENYITYSDTTTAPSKPGKKASAEQKAAYEYRQVLEQQDLTKTVKQEMEALKGELQYKATVSTKNQSDEQILESIDWSKYPNVAKARKSIEDHGNNLLNLNEGFDFSDDWIMGQLWAIRNDYTDGNMEYAMAMSALGYGNQWQENLETQAKLNPGDYVNYAPYSVGSTMEEECLYFGVPGFSRQWVEANRDRYMNSGNPKDREMFGNVAAAQDYVDTVLAEQDSMLADIDYLTSIYSNPEDVLYALQYDSNGNTNSAYKDLFDLDKTTEASRYAEKPEKKLKATTQAIDYRWQDIEKLVREKCAVKANAKSAVGVAEAATGVDTKGTKYIETTGESIKKDRRPNGKNELPKQIETIGEPIYKDRRPNGKNAIPVGEESVSQNDAAEILQKDNRSNEETITEEPVTEEPATEMVTEEPVTEEPVVEAVTEASVTEEPVAETITEEPVTEEHTATETPTSAVTPPPVIDETTQELETQAVKNQEDMAPTVMNKGTQAEKDAMLAMKTSLWDFTVDLVRNAADAISNNWNNVKKNMAGSFMGTADTVADYEEKQQELENVDAALNKWTEEWQALDNRTPSDPALKGLQAQDVETLKWLQSEESIEESDDWWVFSQRLAENPTDQDALKWLYGTVTGDDDYFLRDYQAGELEQAAQWWGLISSGADLSTAIPENPLNDEERVRYEQLSQTIADLTEQKSQTEGYLVANEKAYNQAKMEQQSLMQAYMLGAKLAGDEDISFINTLGNLYYASREYSPLFISPDNPYDMAVADGEITADMARQEAQKESIASMDYAIRLEDALEEAAQYGIVLSDKQVENVESWIEGAKISSVNAAYNLLDYQPDFEEKAKAGMEKALNGEYDDRLTKALAKGHYDVEWTDALSSLSAGAAAKTTRDLSIIQSYVDSVTEKEKLRYFYLYETEGIKAAKEYWNNLTNDDYGTLTARRTRDIEQEASEFAGRNFWTGMAATGLSFFSNFMGGAEALIYELAQRGQGKRVNTNSVNFTNQVITGALRQGTREQFVNAMGGEGSVGGFFTGVFYDGFTSFMDSYITGMATTGVSEAASDILHTGKLGELVSKVSDWFDDTKAGSLFNKFADTGVGKFIGKATSDVEHAAMMGLNAAANAYRDAVIRYGDGDQAAQMALVTFLSETLSEAITYKNFRTAFSAGGDASIQGWNAVKSLVVGGLEEAFGEGGNTWVEEHWDQIIMGKNSNYQQTVKQLTDNGIPQTIAEEMAAQQVVKDVLTSAFTGFISSGMGEGVEYARGKLESRGTANTQTAMEAPVAAPITAENVINQDVEAPITSENVIEETVENQSVEAPAEAPITSADVNDTAVEESVVEEPVDPAKAYRNRVTNEAYLLEAINGTGGIEALAPEQREAAVLEALGGDTENSQKMAVAAYRYDPGVARRASSVLKALTFAGELTAENEKDIKSAIAVSALGGRDSKCYQACSDIDEFGNNTGLAEKILQALNEDRQNSIVKDRVKRNGRSVTEDLDLESIKGVQIDNRHSRSYVEPVTAESVIDQERAAAEAEIAASEAAREQEANELLGRDLNALSSTFGSSQTGTAVGIAAVLDQGKTQKGKFAAQASSVAMIRMASGNTTVASSTVQGIIAAAGRKTALAKTAITVGTLTDGNTNAQLNQIIGKVQSGIAVTTEDVNTLIDTAKAELRDPNAKAAMVSRIKEHRTSARMMEIFQNGEAGKKVKATQKKVKQAQEGVANAQENLNNAQAAVQTATEILNRAVSDHLSDAQNPEHNGTVEQAANQVEAAVKTTLPAAENDVANAQQNLADAIQEQSDTEDAVLTEVRQQAQAEIEQEYAQEAQEEQAAYEEAAAEFAPMVPFGRTVTVATEDGGEVNLTGVHDVVNDGFLIMYTTDDGQIISSDSLLMDTLPTDLIYSSDRFIQQDMKPAGRPLHYFPNSFNADVAGEEKTMVGFAGYETVDGMKDPVIMDIDGNVYSLNDPNVNVPFESRDYVYDLFDYFDDMPEMNDVPRVTVTEVENADDSGSEQTGPEYEAETGLSVQGVVGEGNNPGQLAAASGPDGGLGDNSNAESGTGQETSGRGTESATQYNRPDQSRVSERLLSTDTRNALSDKGVTDLNLHEETDQQLFSSALSEAKSTNSHGAYVDAQSPESLTEKGAIIIMSEDGLAGAAIGTVGNEAGNIFGVFKDSRSTASRASTELIIQAVAQGGNKLDCYDGNLRGMYAAVGMIPVARVQFNEEFMPDGWNVERDDHPDIVFWMHNGDSAETIAEKYRSAESEGGYHVYTDEEITNLPLFEDVTDENGETQYGYDRAWAYRDQLLAERMASLNSQSGNTPGKEIQGLWMRFTPNLTPTQRQSQKVKNELESPQRIAQRLADKLGYGNYMGTKDFGNLPSAVRGFWNNHGKYLAVRTQDTGKYWVTVHEIGHGVADQLGITGTDDMVTNLLTETPEFGDNYGPDELKGEAFAEFMWRYLESEDRARNFAGDAFYDDFERRLALNPEMADTVNEAREQMQQYINAETNERIGSRIVYDRSGERGRTVDRIKEFMQNAITGLVDKSYVAEEVNNAVREITGNRDLDISKNLRAMSLLTNHSQKQALYTLTDNLISPDGTILSDGLGKMLADAGFKGTDENLKLLEQYQLALHSLDRDVQGKAVFSEDITTAEREQFIADIQATRPDVVAAEQAFQQFRHDFLQTWMVDTGYWSQDLLDKMEAMYPHYVPTFRVGGNVDSMNNMGGGKSGNKYTLRAAKGSTQDVYSPFYSFVGMVDQIVSMVNQNRVAQTFDNLYQEYDGLGEFARPVPEKTGLNRRQMEIREALEGEISDDLMERVLGILRSSQSERQGNADNLITVQREDGTTMQYQVLDPELFNLLAGVQGSSNLSPFNVIGKLTRAMSMLTTGSNPLFAARNAMRDYQNSVNYGSWASNYLTGIPKWLSTFYNIWRGDATDEEYRALGGGGWTRIDQNSPKSMNEVKGEVFGKDTSTMGKKAQWLGGKLWDLVTLSRLNEVIEQTSRQVEYRYGKHDTTTPEGRQEAFLAAQDVTVDFSRRGSSPVADALKKLIPFFGASVQGVARTARQLTTTERSRVGTRFTKTLVNQALTSALALGLISKFSSDDEKEAFGELLSDGIKANHLVLPNPLKDQPGQAPFIRIPLAQDPLAYAVHGAVTNALWNGTEDETAISLAATADVILDNLNPFGSGTIFQPILDASHNKTWYGTPIVRNNQQDWTDPSSQYNDDTPDVFKGLGNLLNMSPEILEYLATQYTGFLGSVGIPALTLDKNGKIGGFEAVLKSAVKSWTADPTTSNNVTNSFYDMAAELSTIKDEANKDRPQGLLLRSLSQEEVDQAYLEAEKLLSSDGIIGSTKKKINEAYKKIDQINSNDALTDDEKYQLTKNVRMDMLKQVQIANETLEAYQKKYITGETLTDRFFGGLMKRLQPGATANVPTDEDLMPETFQTDRDNPDSTYMQRVQEVYDQTGKSSALPHPSQTFNVKTRLGRSVEVTIPDDEWEKYTEIYKREYEKFLSSPSLRWETLSLEQKKQKLTSAHTKANKAVKDAYTREHAAEIEQLTTAADSDEE